MGKVLKSVGDDPNQDDLRLRIARRKKLHEAKDHLEEIRQKALAAKRKLMLQQQKGNISQKSRSSFMKTLSEFSAQRQALEDATKTNNILLNKETISEENNPKPLNIKGLFKAGVKSKLLSNCKTTERRLVRAVLDDDALKLLQSGNFIQRKPIDSKVKAKFEKNMEIANILRSSSESGDSVDDILSTQHTVRTSPVFIGGKGYKKKSDLSGKLSNNIPAQLAPHNRKPSTKEERCKRKLFQDKRANINRQIENDILRFSPSRSTPENMIFFAKHLQHNNVHNQNRNHLDDHEIDADEPKLIKSYVQTCKIIAQKEFENLFDDLDPLKGIKTALRVTYKKEFQAFVENQKMASANHRQSKALDGSASSSNSEIMLEPDSQIARALKKNSQKVEENATFFSESTSDSDSSPDNSDLAKVMNRSQNLANDNAIKRKRAPSSKGDHSEPDISSTAANVDPRSIRRDLKMNSIHPDRQELIARYLQDVDTTSDRISFLDADNEAVGKATSNNRPQIQQKEKLFISDDSKRMYIQKSTKHIPAILRKNRPSVDCVSKEKLLLSFDKPVEVHKEKLAFVAEEMNNLARERTPNCENPDFSHLKVPKCKLMHMNAKYNQPTRINIPVIQNKKAHKNTMPEKYMFASPRGNQRNLVVNHNFELSPVSQQANNLEFYRQQFSQENSENSNCIPRMVSFGEIQERTNRLTLRASQNCSQGNSELPQEPLNLFPHFHFTKCDSSSSCMSYNNSHSQRVYNGMSSSQTINELPSHEHQPHGAIKYNEEIRYKAQSDARAQQHYYVQDPDGTKNFCQSNNCEECILNNCHQQAGDYQHQLVEYVSAQQQNVCQPVKFVAVEGNKIPQRHPLYKANDASYAYVHKASASNRQQAPIVMPHYPRNLQSQAHHARSSLQYRAPSATASLMTADYEYKNLRDANAIIPAIPQGARNPMNFVPSAMNDQSYPMQQSATSATSMSNPTTYVGVPFQMQMISPLYPQAEYHPGHHANSEARAPPTGAYVQQVDYNFHLKRL